MSATTAEERIAAVLALHVRTGWHAYYGTHRCKTCRQPWPCRTARLLDPEVNYPACEDCAAAVAAEEARLAQARVDYPHLFARERR